jgi:hypothetical protein
MGFKNRLLRSDDHIDNLTIGFLNEDTFKHEIPNM